MTTRLLLAIGQRAAGDDGVGPAVLDRVRALGLPGGVDARELGDPSALVALLDGASRAVIVDAIVSDPAGRVVTATPEQLAVRAAPMSSHGLGVADALALARALSPRTTCADVVVVGVTITRPRGLAVGLSDEVSRAVDEAARAALAQLEA